MPPAGAKSVAKSRRSKPRRVIFPCPVVVDTREKKPYAFRSIRADARQGGGIMEVQAVSATVPSGDYSLLGFVGSVAVERKSIADLFGTLGKGRERFERELDRLSSMECPNVVVEAEWSEILDNYPQYSRLSPKSVFRSVNAWKQRYRRIHWEFVPGRQAGEVWTFRILERFFAEKQRAKRSRQC